MPIFDLQCSVCGQKKLDEFLHNDKQIPVCCGEKMKKMIAMIHPGFPKYGLTLTNVESQPVHFESRKQLLNYKRKHNLELGALPND